MVFTIKVTLIYGPYATDKWQGVFEVESGSVLEEIHALIRRTLNFDDDHLYEFFISRTERGRDRISFDDENGGLYDTSIDSLFPLPAKKSLYYLFDYGDNWLFKITKATKAAREPNRDEEFPRLIDESGSRPPQYPAYDEDDP